MNKLRARLVNLQLKREALARELDSTNLKIQSMGRSLRGADRSWGHDSVTSLISYLDNRCAEMNEEGDMIGSFHYSLVADALRFSDLSKMPSSAFEVVEDFLDYDGVTPKTRESFRILRRDLDYQGFNLMPDFLVKAITTVAEELKDKDDSK